MVKLFKLVCTEKIMSFMYDDEEGPNDKTNETSKKVIFSPKSSDHFEEREDKPGSSKKKKTFDVENFRFIQTECQAALCLANQQKKQFRQLLKKYVIKEDYPNPFLAKNYCSEELLQKLKNYILKIAFIRHSESNIFQDDEDIAFITDINKKLTHSLLKIGSLGPDVLHDARIYRYKNFRDLKKVDLNSDDSSSCGATDCENIKFLFQVCLSNPVNQNNDEKIFYFCKAHMRVFEFLFTFLHMEWNIAANCEEWFTDLSEKSKTKFKNFKNEFPADIVQNLCLFYMNRYARLWVHGDYEFWSENGLNMFTTLSDQKE